MTIINNNHYHFTDMNMSPLDYERGYREWHSKVERQRKMRKYEIWLLAQQI